MSSLWQQTASAIDTDSVEDAFAFSCDAVVVGAGLTGLTTALLLARAGLKVTVLEARTVGAVTTGNSAGMLSLLQGTTFSELCERVDADVLRAYALANREGQAWLVRELETRGEHVERRRAFTYATNAEQRRLLDDEVTASATAGINVQYTEATGLPFETFGALTLGGQVLLQPMVVLRMLVRELREHHGIIAEGCRVRDVEVEDDRLRIVTPRGVLDAGLCVLATGTPILDSGQFFAKLSVSRSHVAAYQLSEGQPPEDMYVSAGAPIRSLQPATGPDGEPLLLVGGPAASPGHSGDSLERLRGLDTWAARNFRSARRVHWWAAQDYRTHSRIPFAGALPRGAGRIYAATGFNGWGMSNAVSSALAIASEILDGRMDWALTLNEHCVRFAEAGEAIRSNARVAQTLVSGWAAAELRPIESLSEPAEGEGVVGRDGLDPVAISKVGGRVRRLSAVCTYEGGIVRWNTAERSWDCPLHGCRFAADGTVLEGAAVMDLPQQDGG